MTRRELSERVHRLVDLTLKYVGHPTPIADHMDADIRLRDAALAVHAILEADWADGPTDAFRAEGPACGPEVDELLTLQRKVAAARDLLEQQLPQIEARIKHGAATRNDERAVRLALEALA